MTHWQEVSLTDLGSVERGRSRHRPRNDPRLFGDTLPFFQTGDVKAATLHMMSTNQYYSDFGVAQSRVWEPGITCITIAANIAESAVLGRRGCFPDSVLGFTAALQPEDAYFVKYLLDVHRERLTSAARGTTQDNLSLEKLLAYRFPVPDSATRRRIAAVLRSIDELIENNRRRAEVLEEMARAIYQEWFVHFRYPGHEDVALVDSLLGPVPRGWKVSAASEALEINPRLRIDSTVERPFLTMGDLSSSGMMCFPSEAKTGNSGSKFQNGDTLFARITPCLENGKTGLVQCLEEGQVGRGSTEFIVLRGVAVGRAFTYFLARSDGYREHAIKSMSGASGRQRVRNECFDSLKLAVPPADLARRFEALVDPQVRMVHRLALQATRLLTMREILLPKLIAGQIDVSSLDLDALVEGRWRDA